MNMEAIWTFVTTQGVDFAMKVVGALVIWVVGRWLIGFAHGWRGAPSNVAARSTTRWPPTSSRSWACCSTSC